MDKSHFFQLSRIHTSQISYLLVYKKLLVSGIFPLLINHFEIFFPGSRSPTSSCEVYFRTNRWIVFQCRMNFR